MIGTNPGLIVVDVREEETEYCDDNPTPPPPSGHIPGALNYPWSSGVFHANYQDLPADADILVVCRSGARSAQASNFLCTNGYTSIYNMTGGMLQWQWDTVLCCYSDPECDDGIYCNGEETCFNLNCQPGTDPCTQSYYKCDEVNDICEECLDDYDCDSLTDEGDNCPEVPNGLDKGTCVEQGGNLYFNTGVTCFNDAHCENGETCQMNQEDSDLDGVGDACECYADMDGDGNVYPSDLITIIDEYGRTDCVTNPCQADIDGDGSVYPSDLMIFFVEWGRENCATMP